MFCMHVYYNAETDRIIIYCDREQIQYEGTEVDLLYCKCCCSRKVRFKFLFTGNVLEKLPFILGFLCQIHCNKCKATVERDVYSYVLSFNFFFVF